MSITYSESFWNLLSVHLLVHVVIESLLLRLQTAILAALSFDRRTFRWSLHSTFLRSFTTFLREVFFLVIVRRHFLL